MEKSDLLDECRLQLEYLNEKFGETGTTNSLLSRIKTELSKETPENCLGCGKHPPELCGSCVSDIAQETGNAAMDSR